MWYFRSVIEARSRTSFGLALCLLVGAVATPCSAQSQEQQTTFEELSARAASLREAGKAEDAIQSYEAALQLRSDWLEGWWYLGTLQYDRDRYQQAAAAFEHAVELNPDLGPAFAFLGLSEFETKDYARSYAHLQQADVKGYGDDEQLQKVARYHLAMLENLNGEFEKTMQIASSSVSARNVSDQWIAVLGLSLLRAPLLPTELSPDKDALVHGAGIAALQLASGRQADAAESLHRLVNENSAVPFLHLACGRVLASLKNYREALAQFSQEQRVSPDSELPFLEIARLHLRSGHQPEALGAARRAVQLAPQSSQAHETLGAVLRAMGRNSSAAKEEAEAQRFQNARTEPHRRLRELYARKITSEPTAQPTPDAVNHPSPPDTAAVSTEFQSLSQRAASAFASGQLDLASGYYRDALALNPSWEEGWRNLGTLYYVQQTFPEAIKALRNAIALDASHGTIWALLGLSEFQMKDYENAYIHLDRGSSVGLAGNPAAIQVAKYHLGLLLNRRGDFDRATIVLTPGSGAGPAEKPVKIALGLALLRMPLLPDEIPARQLPLVELAGETAAFLVESKYDEAFRRFDQLLAQYPATPFLHYAYGSALMSASKFDEADKQFSEETRVSAKNALPYRRRAAIALQLRQRDEALKLAEQAIALDSQSPEAHYLRGRALLELSRNEEALGELETARTLAPNNPEVHFALAKAYAKSGQPDAAEKERAIFERLNAAIQMQKSQTGSQAYSAH